MRISTSQEFSQQTYALDTLNAEQANYAQQLSSGKSLTYPSDNPTQIAEDISFRTDITVQTQVGNNLSSTQQQLTTVDSALANVTGVLQSARSLAIQGASDTLTPAQEQAIATQVDQLLQETVGFANTQYAGQYVFAGTAAPTSLPVQTVGSPISAVTFGGNEVPQTQTLPDGQTLTTSVTMRQAFNYGSTDGSPDVFQTLNFPRFGEFTYTQNDVFTFPWGLPGFPNLHRWIALNLESQSTYIWLQSLDDVAVALPTIDPWMVFENYDPKLPAYAVAALEIADAGDFAMLCVVVATADAQEMTMNLMAPIVVNLRARRGRQIMLENSSYSVREPIPRKATAEPKAAAPSE